MAKKISNWSNFTPKKYPMEDVELEYLKEFDLDVEFMDIDFMNVQSFIMKEGDK